MRIKDNKVKSNSRSKSVKWIFRLFTTIGVFVLYYMLFSMFFDTPIEYQLKKSTNTLQSHYVTLEKRYDSIQKVLANLAHRDSAVYRIIYEAQPYVYKESSDYEFSKLKDKLNKMSNKELGDYFYHRLDRIEVEVDKGQMTIAGILQGFIDDPSKINRIPSIQPIDNPDLSLLATSYGRRINPFFKTMQQHDGVDYAIPDGTAVFATADGVISEIKTRGSNNGLSMTINHDNGYKTVYAYLSKTYGQVGSKVNRGDVIAFSGNSGLSYAPHLHYEILKDGKSVNPLGYFFLELNKDEMIKMYNIASHAMQAFD